MTRLRQFLALARFTTLEALRQPVCLLLILTCLVSMMLVPLLSLHRFGEDGKLVRDSAFALHAVFGVFVAGYAASTALSREMRTGTALVVLSKPVSRDLFLLAKYAGVAGVVLCFSFCAGVMTLLSERVAEVFLVVKGGPGYLTDYRTGYVTLAAVAAACVLGGIMNYCRGRPFGSTTAIALGVALALAALSACCFNRWGYWAPFEMTLKWSIVPVSLLVTMALLVLAALALVLSTMTGPAPTLALCAGVFWLGLLSDYLFGRHAATSLLARLAYTLLPNWQHFWMGDALDQGGRVPWGYVWRAAGYAAAYAAALLCAGVLVFHGRDMSALAED